MKGLLPDLLLVALLSALSIFFYNKTIAFWPSHIHAWTQGDRYALAVKFADTGLNLFKPRTFNLQTRDGITAVDLPVHDYVVGVMMHLTGNKNPGVFRIYTLIFSMLGCWFLFRMARDASGSAAKGMAVAVFVFTCPVITYYQTGFIPSATSFSAVLMGYYFYFRYRKNPGTNTFYWAIGLFTLAALSRSPFNIFLFGTLLQQGMDWFQNRKIVRREARSYALAYTVIAAANFYKIWLAQAYGSQFLGELRPAPSLEAFGQILRSVLERWMFQVFSPGHYALLALAVFFLALRLLQRKTDALTRQILLQSGLVIAGGLIYFVLMARQYVDHEYYFMDSLYPGAVLLLVAGVSCMPSGPLTARLALGAVAVCCLTLGAAASKRVQEEKYSDKPSEQAETTRKNFIGSERLLDSLGIVRDARMLVIDAWSTNIPLILMNRMGYTLLSTRRPVLENALDWDYDFVVVQDLYFPSDVVSNYPAILNRLDRIGGNGRITIFRKTTAQRTATLAEALGIGNVWKVDSFDFQTIPATSGWKYTEFGTEQFVSPPQAGVLGKDREFGPTFEITASENAGRRDFRKVLFEGWYYARNSDDKLHTIATLESNGQIDFYSGYAFRVDSVGAWRQFHSLFFLPDTVPKGQQLKCYIWNPDASEMYFDDFKVTLY